MGMSYSQRARLTDEEVRTHQRVVAARLGVQTRQRNEAAKAKRMALADKIVMAVVDQIAADIIRPGPKPAPGAEDVNEALTPNAAAFMAANIQSPVRAGQVIGRGGEGATYTLQNGQVFTLSREECETIGRPRWEGIA